MSPASQTSVRIKIVFGDGIAFVCFYNAERVLSAVAKFLVHLLGVLERAWNVRGGSRGKE